MIFLDVLYVALSTIGIMALLQLTTFVVMKLLYPPAPEIIYRNVPVPVQQQETRVYQQQPPPTPQVTFTQPTQEVVLPEYEPRKPIATSIRMDPELPAGIQETRPPGT